MATISQREDTGIWYLQFNLENGKQVRKSLKTRDKAEAQRVLEKTNTLLLRKEYGLLPRSKEERCVKEFLDSRIRNIHATKFPSTAQVETVRIAHFRDYLAGQNIVYMGDIRTEDVEKYMALRAQTLAVKTLNETLRLVKQVFEQAVESQIIPKSRPIDQ